MAWIRIALPFDNEITHFDRVVNFSRGGWGEVAEAVALGSALE